MSPKVFVTTVCFLLVVTECVSQFFDNKPLYNINAQTFKDYTLSTNKDVSMANCRIKTVDKNTFVQMVRLETLRMDQNELSTLHANMFDNNVKLVSLNLAQNRFQALPPYIFAKLTSLRELSLYKNNIKYLDLNTFSSLRSLTRLIMYSNGLTQLDANIFRNNINMQYLHFGDNFIEELHEDIFNNMPNLNSLLFQKNRIRSLPKKLFSRLPNLRILSMGYNNIPNLDSELFENNRNLDSVWLNENKITELKTGLFKNSGLLKYLNLHSNKIDTLESGVFPINSQLQKLNITNNSLSNLDAQTVTNLNRLTVLLVDQNPWFCNCNLRELFTKWRNLNSPAVPTCANPPSLRGKPWSNLNSADFICAATHKIDDSSIELTGDEATLSCQISAGSELQDAQWKIGDRKVTDYFKTLNKPYRICQSTTEDGRTWFNLTIQDLKPSDSGNYKCSVGDQFSKVEKEENLFVTSELLRKLKKPTLSLSLDKELQLTADFGETITAGCQIYSRSTEKPYPVWSFNNLPLDDVSTGSKYQFKSFKVDDRLSWYNLTIASVTDDDSGVYSCQTNGYNNVNKFVLKVSKKLNTYIQGWTAYE